jgi:hypothetical protein
MKKLLFFLLLLIGGMIQVKAQNIILDFETPETSTTFSYFDNGDW